MLVYTQEEQESLIADGLYARSRSIGHLCRLGAEIEGAGFDSEAWKKVLENLTLPEIETQLQGFELRFERMIPTEEN